MAGVDVNIPKDPIGVKGTNGTSIASPANPLDVQVVGDVTVDIDSSDLATEATLATRLSEATFSATDFATQTTLEAARALLASLDGKDFATGAAQTDGSQRTGVLGADGSTIASPANPVPTMGAGQALLFNDAEALGAGATLSTGWIDTEKYPDLYFFWYAYVEPASVTQSWSQDGVNPVEDPDDGQDSVFTGPNALPVQDLGTAYIVNSVPSRPKVARYVKYDVTNGATPQTSPGGGLAPSETLLWGLDQPYTGSYSTISAALNESSLNAFHLGRSVIMGQQPDGDVVNARADGLAFTNDTPLAGGAEYTSDWIDTDQWRSIEVVITTDVPGAADGVIIEYTDDAQAATPVVRTSRLEEFGQFDVLEGSVVFYAPTELDGFRLRYVNGTAAQGSFFVAATLRTSAVESPRSRGGGIITSNPWRNVFKATYETHGAFPSGSAPTFDALGPVVASNVIDTGWLNSSDFKDQLLTLFFDCAGIEVYLMNASDSDGNNSPTKAWDATASRAISVANAPVVTGAPFFGDYFRIVVINTTGTTCNEWSIRAKGGDTPPGPVYQSLDQPILDFFPAPVTQTVAKGKSPDGDYTAARNQGRHAANSTTALLNGDTGGSDHIFRGEWFEWQDSYVGVQTEIRSDVAGTIYLDFSTVASPTNGDETSVSFSISQDYDPANGVGVYRRTTGLQSRWVRMRYENGLVAQSEFSLDAAFLTTPLPDTTEPLSTNPRDSFLAGIEKTIDFSKDSDDGTYAPIYRTGNARNVHVSTIDAEVPIKPLDSVNVGQGTATSGSAVPIPSAGTGLTNRKTLEFSNHSNTVNVYWGPTNAVTASTGKILRPGADVVVEVDESVDFYWIAEDTGGTTAQSDESGTTTAGTADTTANALASDDSRTLFDDAETLEVDGFGYTQALTDINTLRIGVEARKAASPTTQTLAHVETQNGTTSGATSVVSSSVAGGSGLLYLVAVARNAANTVSGISGAGLSFTRIVNDVQINSKRLDIWYAYGDGTTGAITASMSSSARANILVSTFTGADPDTPIEEAGVGATGTGTLATTNTLNKTENGLFYAAMLHEAVSATAGTGYTEPANGDTTNGTGSNRVSLAGEYKVVSTTGTEGATMNLVSSNDWAIAGVTILPGATQDVVLDVEYDVNGGGYTSVGSLTLDSTTDSTQFIDISGTHPLTETTINQTTIRLTRNSAGAAQGEVDHVYLEVTEGDDDTAARLSYAEVADSAYP